MLLVLSDKVNTTYYENNRRRMEGCPAFGPPGNIQRPRHRFPNPRPTFAPRLNAWIGTVYDLKMKVFRPLVKRFTKGLHYISRMVVCAEIWMAL
jgi:hypothetical protein